MAVRDALLVARMVEYCEEIIGDKPYELILTHGHFDHSGGASQFETVWIHRDDLELAQRHTDRKMRAGFLARDGWKFEWEDLAEEKLSGYLPLEYRQKFDLGNEVLEIVNLGGHTPGSIGILMHVLSFSTSISSGIPALSFPNMI